MKKYPLRVSLLLLCLFFLGSAVFGQARMILNGAKINIRDGATLVLANGAANALTRNSGHIISEGETNVVKWVTQNDTGTYILPWGVGNADYIPFVFTKTAGSGSGYYSFSTYATGWQNSLQLPAGITNLNHDNQDNSAFVLDRFWQINAQGYTRKPDLSNLVFSYLETEYTAPGNSILEDGLRAQRWNSQTNEWGDLMPTGQVNTTDNTVTVASVSEADAYQWWALVEENSPLPLFFLSFNIRQEAGQAVLSWQTTMETNVKNFEIQRTADAHDFQTVGKVPAKGGSAKNDYAFTDNNLVPGINYYRIKSIDMDDAFLFSRIRVLNYDLKNELIVFPNPIQNNTIQMSGAQLLESPYAVYLYDLQGRLLQQELLKVKSNIVPWPLKNTLKPGIYLFQVVHGSSVYQEKVLVE